ncbi:hypothetical protein VPNG_03967 [Cytospora leucostoma]|uniref:Uncharacterized protein n=1 Tax=Cytospora leucostoma TaxID=1230097 RepID=A0A423XDY5_9PEZI|nr:hypothetical protein VPNG_03967 [Cytospora leucostoma]
MSSTGLKSVVLRGYHRLTGQAAPKRERVVILGSGWAGYAFARTLDPNKYERIVVSPRSYFVFTPLLASTSVGTLEFRATLESIRRLGDVQFHQGWADEVNFQRKVIRVEESYVDDLSKATLPPPPSSSSPTAPNAISTGAGGGDVQAPKKGPVTEVGYDKLVIAVGAYSQTFGIEGVRQHAHFLRDVGDAKRVRLRVLSLFEQCMSSSMSDQDRRKLLHFVVVGGGPTGIEFAAELHDLIDEDLRKMYPSLLPYVQITIYDVAPKILPMFDQALASYAMGMIRKHKININTSHSIQRIRPDPEGSGALNLRIKEYGDEEVGAGIVVWSTGLMQNPFIEKMVCKGIRGAVPGQDPSAEFKLQKDRRTGGVIVDGQLRARVVDAADAAAAAAAAAAPTPAAGNAGTGAVVPAPPKPETHVLEDVYVIGDCAVVDGQRNLPKTAQVASQQAFYLASALNKGESPDAAKPFVFRNLGAMTYLGNWRALWQKDKTDLTGRAAWILWRTAYLTRSMSWKNRVLIPFYWLVSWIFGRDISRF